MASIVKGVEWYGGKTAGGRFCSVFEFRGWLIARMHIYLDLDYASRDRDRFLRGPDRQWRAPPQRRWPPDRMVDAMVRVIS
jgi:hypothetical protein